MPSFETPQPITATVDLALGDLRVTASDRGDAVAVVQPTNPAHASDVTAAKDTRVEYADGRLTIVSPKHWRRFTPFDHAGSVQVVLDLPTGSHLDATTSLGHVRVDGELGRCRVKTAMGDVRVDRSVDATVKTSFGNVDVDRVDGDADIRTGSGDVRVGRISGTGFVKNSNGDTSIDEVSGEMKVKAANGNVSIRRAGDSVAARTAAGSIDIGELRHGVATLETAAGNLACGIADGTAVNLDVRCAYGRIQSGLETTEGPTPTDEVLELHAHTSAGDVTLYRTDHHAPTGT